MKKNSEQKIKFKKRKEYDEESDKDINDFKHNWKTQMEEEYYNDLTNLEFDEKT